MFHSIQLLALLALCAPAALGKMANSYDPNDPPQGTVYDGFQCTTSGGVVMQSNLPDGCAEWWPGCALKPDPPWPGKKCPGYCKRAYFKVRYVPIQGAEPYIHHRHYSSYSNSSTYNTTTWDGQPSSALGNTSETGSKMPALQAAKGVSESAGSASDSGSNARAS